MKLQVVKTFFLDNIIDETILIFRQLYREIISFHTPQASSKVVKAGTTLVLKTDCTLSYWKLPKASGKIQFLNHTVLTFCIATSAKPQIDEVVRLPFKLQTQSTVVHS